MKKSRFVEEKIIAVMDETGMNVGDLYHEYGIPEVTHRNLWWGNAGLKISEAVSTIFIFAFRSSDWPRNGGDSAVQASMSRHIAAI